MFRSMMTVAALVALTAGCATTASTTKQEPAHEASREMLQKSDKYPYEFEVIGAQPFGPDSFLVTAHPVGHDWMSGPMLTSEQLLALCRLYGVQSAAELRGKRFFARKNRPEHAEIGLEEVVAHAMGQQAAFEAKWYPPTQR